MLVFPTEEQARYGLSLQFFGPADRHSQASVTNKRKDKQKAPVPSEGETDESGTSPVTEDSDSDFQPEEHDEKAMLATAVRLSLQTAAQTNGAGPSSDRVSGLSPAVRRRAVAAERRLPAGRSNAFECSTSEDLEDLSDASSEKYPLQSRTKMAEKKKVAASADGKVDISYPDFMATQKKKRTAFLSARLANKKEERALMKKLRRKLTHVGRIHASRTTVTFIHSQAERTTIALQRNHPELQGVWVNLEANTPKGIPQKATQPTDLKVTLLPFQLESLFWMRKQEKGVWHGGILAVSFQLHPIFGI